jgi:hypothetical protein
MCTSATESPAVAVLIAALSRGVELRLEPDRPGLFLHPASALSPSEREILQAAKADAKDIVTELRWRTAAMRHQVPPAPRPIPSLLARPDVPPEPDTCISCAEPLAEASVHARCGLCALAAWLALADYEAQRT